MYVLLALCMLLLAGGFLLRLMKMYRIPYYKPEQERVSYAYQNIGASKIIINISWQMSVKKQTATCFGGCRLPGCFAGRRGCGRAYQRYEVSCRSFDNLRSKQLCYRKYALLSEEKDYERLILLYNLLFCNKGWNL